MRGGGLEVSAAKLKNIPPLYYVALYYKIYKHSSKQKSIGLEYGIVCLIFNERPLRYFNHST